MRIQGFRGNCDSKGKLGMCPSLAEPDSDGFSKNSVFSYEPQANEKFFGAAVFQKCCRGVGEQPTFAKQIGFCSLFFLLQLHFLKLTNSQFDYFMKQVANSDKATGQLQHAGRQKQGWNPLLPDAEDRFS